ncbi:MAG: transcription termination/antitermination protein NusG [Planctomycetota bacterium]
MSDGTPSETGAELGAELSAKPSPDGPSEEPSASDTPADVEAAPVETEPTPADVEPAPVEIEAVPVETEPTPADVEPAPVEIEAVPVETEPTPADVEPAPVEIEPVPVETEPVPVETEPAPVETESAPVETEPASVETKPAPVKTKPAPAAETSGDEKSFDPAADLPTYREGMDWFVLRVASNKENYVRETLLRKVQIEGLNDRVGRIMVPTEKTKTLKGGKTKITETKLYPGYIFVEMRLESDGRIPQDVFFLIKETTGVGDFVGTAGRPTPMAVHEAEKMLFDSRRPEETPSVKMEFSPGDYVTITEGPFESYEGTVDEVLPDKGLVRVLVTIFGRQAPVELEYWQIQKAE